MEEILKELIKQNTKVIIPDFGAFIVKQRNPLQVVFNEFLRFNDGLLIDSLSKKENITKEEAKNRINKWVENIKLSLDKSNEYEISGFGKFVKLESGKIHFEINELKETLKKEKELSEKGEGEGNLNNIAKTSKEFYPDQSQKPSDIQQQNEIKKIDLQITPPNEKKKEAISTEKNKVIPPVEKTVKYREPYQPELTYTISTKKTDSKLNEKSFDKMPLQKNKRKTRKIIRWLFLLIFINLILVLIFIYSENIIDFYHKNLPILKQRVGVIFKEKNKVFEKKIEKNIKQSEQTELNNDTRTAVKSNSEEFENKNNNLSSESKKEEKADISSNNSNLKNKYYIVAGCFKEESNADVCVIMLRNKGYPAEKFGKIGDLTAVCYASFNNKEEALEALKTIRNKESKEAWIFHY